MSRGLTRHMSRCAPRVRQGRQFFCRDVSTRRARRLAVFRMTTLSTSTRLRCSR